MLADRRTRVLIVSLAALLVVLSLTVGGTPGVFTDEEVADGNQFSASDDFDASTDNETTSDDNLTENETTTDENEMNSTTNGTATD